MKNILNKVKGFLFGEEERETKVVTEAPGIVEQPDVTEEVEQPKAICCADGKCKNSEQPKVEEVVEKTDFQLFAEEVEGIVADRKVRPSKYIDGDFDKIKEDLATAEILFYDDREVAEANLLKIAARIYLLLNVQ